MFIKKASYRVVYTAWFQPLHTYIYIYIEGGTWSFSFLYSCTFEFFKWHLKKNFIKKFIIRKQTPGPPIQCRKNPFSDHALFEYFQEQGPHFRIRKCIPLLKNSLCWIKTCLPIIFQLLVLFLTLFLKLCWNTMVFTSHMLLVVTWNVAIQIDMGYKRKTYTSFWRHVIS